MVPSGLTEVGGREGERQCGGYSGTVRDWLSASLQAKGASTRLPLCLALALLASILSHVPYRWDCGPRSLLPGALHPHCAVSRLPWHGLLLAFSFPALSPLFAPSCSAFSAMLLSLLSLTCLPGMSRLGTGSFYLPKSRCFCCPLPSDSGRNPTR